MKGTIKEGRELCERESHFYSGKGTITEEREAHSLSHSSLPSLIVGRELLQREGRSTVREGRELLEREGPYQRGTGTIREGQALLEREGNY